MKSIGIEECYMRNDEQVKLPDKEPTLRVVPMPADVNQYGDIFGGWIMSQVDIAGANPAARRARGRTATVAVNSFIFKQPVLVGDLVSFYAEITHVGRTSITVAVEVYAQRNPDDVICVKVTEASLTYVAVGPDRRPRQLAPE
jgi:acyl-CoA thioesterase YciA